ncbi:PqiB family protein [Colwellia sp. 20A7]|uniref:PqiB family protein n=1 Tax=Colwellia sp. 20A7 TaxID=2689569 RepID=UPI00135ADC2A|nr:MlaD family protein [Colwellia sp. 20A7]
MTINKSSDNNDLKTNVATADVVPRQGISVIWFIPFIALIFGGWLAIKAISEQGVFITIEFENGSGIVPKKTEVRYKGLVTGLVSKVEPSDDLKSVIAEVEMTQSFTDYLTNKTKFWLVSADISLQGVSGLETLVSGSYINIIPDTDKKSRSQDHFIALNEAPELDMTTPGLHLTLKASVLGSISEDSPITFKQIPIGYVTGYHYVEDSQDININIFIEQEYAHLIKENSLFWNMSGVQINASIAAGVKINTGSLGSILGGGIAVDTMSYHEKLPPAKNGHMFPLHADFQSAEMGYSIELTLDWNSDINHNAAILYQGVTIGTIESFSRIDPKTRKITAQAKVNPRIAPYLTEQSQFYLVSPKIDLSGVSNAKALITGTYINIRPSLQGKPINKFHVFNVKPPYLYAEPGLHLIIESNNRDSLQVGNNIYFKQQVIGSIQAIDTVGAEQHLIHIHIQDKYQHYIKLTSRFYNNSGLKVKASLLGIDVEAQSLQSIITGGISMMNVDSSDNALAENAVINGEKFTLFANQKIAEQRVSFTLVASANEKINASTRVLYRGVEIGAIHSIEADGDNSKLSLGLLPEYEHILREGTQFWLAKPSITLSGAADTDALFGGAYITFDFNSESQVAKTNFSLLTSPPAKSASAPGLQLSLLANSATVATAGSRISYRGIVVGQVDNVVLDKKTDKVHVNVTIDDEHKTLIQAYTRFYNASGITLSGGLGGFVVKTESIDAMLRGGISFYNPEATEKKQAQVKELDSFELFDNVEQAENAGLAISVYFNDYTGLKVNTHVVYQGQKMGSITRLIFNPDEVGVTALVLLNDIGAKFAQKGTNFWVVEPEIGLVGSKNVSSLLDGAFISLLPSNQPSNQLSAQQTVFEALELPPTVKQLPYGLNIKLVTERLGSVRIGNPVLYRQVKVGVVIGIDLSPTADTVDVYINIAKRYAPLVNSGSKFWNTSGINIDAGLFSGINIDSESIETLISGGIAFASPALSADEPESAPLVNSFLLHQTLDKDWLEWQPKIAIDQ